MAGRTIGIPYANAERFNTMAHTASLTSVAGYSNTGLMAALRQFFLSFASKKAPKTDDSSDWVYGARGL